MDFFGFGTLKQALFRRRVTSFDGLCKVLDDKWRQVTPEICRKVSDSWKRLLRSMSEKDREHVENTKNLHPQN